MVGGGPQNPKVRVRRDKKLGNGKLIRQTAVINNNEITTGFDIDLHLMR
jgi:hypothetical protein